MIQAIGFWRMAFSVLVLCIASSLYATNPDSRFSEGAARLEAKDYEGAIAIFQGLLVEGQEGYSVYYLLGNAHYRLDHIGEAVLYYEKAVKQLPHNKDAQFNLKLARQKVQDRFAVAPAFFPVRMWRYVRDLFKPVIWFWAALGLIWLACGLQAFAWYKHPGSRFSPSRLALILACCAFVCVGFGVDRQQTLEVDRVAVFLETIQDVKKAPDQQSEASFKIHEGIKVQITDELNGWWQIELPDGKNGWVKPNGWGRV